MNDHFSTLGITEAADDETVRKAYLQRVRAFPPDREPVRFQEIRAAFDALADGRDRLSYRLFSTPQPDVMPLLCATLLEESAPRPPTEALLLEILRESLKAFRLPLDILEKPSC